MKSHLSLCMRVFFFFLEHLAVFIFLVIIPVASFCRGVENESIFIHVALRWACLTLTGRDLIFSGRR